MVQPVCSVFRPPNHMKSPNRALPYDTNTRYLNFNLIPRHWTIFTFAAGVAAPIRSLAHFVGFLHHDSHLLFRSHGASSHWVSDPPTNPHTFQPSSSPRVIDQRMCCCKGRYTESPSCRYYQILKGYLDNPTFKSFDFFMNMVRVAVMMFISS